MSHVDLGVCEILLEATEDSVWYGIYRTNVIGVAPLHLM
jgi:hypothetical protein